MRPLVNLVRSARNLPLPHCADCLSTLALALLLGLAGRAYPATNNVTSLADAGVGSLRQVIADCAPGDTIVFSVSGIINLSGSELVIERPLVINGPGISSLAISAGFASRVFLVATNVSASLRGMIIRNGATSSDPGGGIYNAGSLSVQDCVISNNATGNGGSGAGAPGAGIYSVGTVSLENFSVCFNRTAAGANGAGGGDANNGQSGQSGGDGGGVWSSGSFSGHLCHFVGNTTGNGGNGGIGRLNGGSGGSGGRGGGIFSLGPMTLIGCTVSNNVCGYGGDGGTAGGIHSVNAVLMGCSVVSNRAGSGGHGASAYHFSGSGGLGGSGGGISGRGLLELTNSTIADNVCGRGGSGPGSSGAGGSGGGLYSDATNLALTACTIVNNASGKGGLPGAPNRPFGPDGLGGGVYGVRAGSRVLNSIIALNSGQHSKVFGAFNSLGHNLIGTTNGATGFDASGDLAGSDAAPLDPKVGPVANYGGPTITVPLLAGSPAVDRGAASGITATDQRGVARPQGRAADIGAFEFQFTIPQITGAEWKSSAEFWVQSSGLPNHTYTLQVSTNLLDWSDHAELVTGSDGMNEFTDSGLGGFVRGFYRLKGVAP